jgi:hypothetical protein
MQLFYVLILYQLFAESAEFPCYIDIFLCRQKIEPFEKIQTEKGEDATHQVILSLKEVSVIYASHFQECYLLRLWKSA